VEGIGCARSTVALSLAPPPTAPYVFLSLSPPVPPYHGSFFFSFSVPHVSIGSSLSILLRVFCHCRSVGARIYLSFVLYPVAQLVRSALFVSVRFGSPPIGRLWRGEFSFSLFSSLHGTGHGPTDATQAVLLRPPPPPQRASAPAPPRSRPAPLSSVVIKKLQELLWTSVFAMCARLSLAKPHSVYFHSS